MSVQFSRGKEQFMIHKFTFGHPIATEAVVEHLSAESGEPEGWDVDETNRQICREMGDTDVVYGLGETVRGLNKRGWQYISDNTDDPHHTEDRRSLYASQNFLLILGDDGAHGIFLDTPGRVTFDIGYTKLDELVITLDDFDADVYVIENDDPAKAVREFRALIGKSYVPPLWAFGYGQSRWSYMDEAEVRDVVKNYRDAGMPIDSVYLDIDYMDSYKDFTVDEKRFPDMAGFVKEMRGQGVHLVPIIDAGVKMEKGYDVCDEGTRKGYFCKDENGDDFIGAVWPGKALFPDFLRPEVRDWFGSLYGRLLDLGIDGFWNDMNEPALFYSQKRLKKVLNNIKGLDADTMSIDEFNAMTNSVRTLFNNKEDYQSFYHTVNGQKIRHDKVHNLYGFNMTRAAGEAFARMAPDRRILLFSRASYVGMHRYGGVWTGDNSSWWSHILLSMQQQPSLDMCGFLFSGSDIGGFGCDATEDLMIRWLEADLFTPLFRNHSAKGTRRQELYRFQNQETFRNLMNLRYALIPYIYHEFLKAVSEKCMYISPLSFAYPKDLRARQIEDQFLIGDSLMSAPVYTQNAAGRYVYLPEPMKLLRMRSAEDFDEEELPAGDHFIPAALNEVLVFLRPGKGLILGRPAPCTRGLDNSDVRIISN